MGNPVFKKFKKRMIDECVDLFIDTFSREPWNDVYESKKMINKYFHNHYKNNYFVGYVVKLDKKIVAMSIGMKKPWKEGMEYYIDEFCVSYKLQGRGIGSWFMKKIEEDIKKHGMCAIMLNTEKGYPAQRFYEKNGFKVIRDMIILTK